MRKLLVYPYIYLPPIDKITIYPKCATYSDDKELLKDSGENNNSHHTTYVDSFYDVNVT